MDVKKCDLILQTVFSIYVLRSVFISELERDRVNHGCRSRERRSFQSKRESPKVI